LREDVSKYFDCDYDVPYMNMSVQVKDTRLTSITHIDNTCRIQTVDGDGHFARLLRKYKEMTGESVILNTSLNIGGSPIASRIWEAKELFSKKGIQDMAIGNNFYDK
jgi:carbamoyltransferase